MKTEFELKYSAFSTFLGNEASDMRRLNVWLQSEIATKQQGLPELRPSDVTGPLSRLYCSYYAQLLVGTDPEAMVKFVAEKTGPDLDISVICQDKVYELNDKMKEKAKALLDAIDTTTPENDPNLFSINDLRKTVLNSPTAKVRVMIFEKAKRFEALEEIRRFEDMSEPLSWKSAFDAVGNCGDFVVSPSGGGSDINIVVRANNVSVSARSVIGDFIAFQVNSRNIHVYEVVRAAQNYDSACFKKM